MKNEAPSTTDALTAWLGNQLPAFQLLLDLLDVGRLETTIGKHGNGLWRALCNLESIEPELIRLLPEGSKVGANLSDSMTLLRALATDRARDEILPANWLIAGKPRDAKKRDVGHPQYSTIDEHPVSAALWRIESGPWAQNIDHLANPRIRLVAAVLVVGNARRGHEGILRNRGRLIKACLALREFLMGNFQAQLALLPASADSVEDFRSRFAGISDSGHPLGSIERYLAWVVDARDLDNDNRGLGGGGRKKLVRQMPPAHIERSPTGEIDTISFMAQPETTLADSDMQIAVVGAPMAEVTQSAELIHAPFEEHVDPKLLSRTFTRTRARTAAAGIARENQRLGGRLSSLTDLEAKLLIRKLKLDAPDGQLTPGALLACTSLLVGRSIKTMVYTSASSQFPEAKDHLRNPLLVRSGAGFCWLVKPGAPEVAPAAVDKRILTNFTPPWLTLPCPFWFGSHFYSAIEKGWFRNREKAVADARRFLQEFDLGQNGIGRYRADRLFSWLSNAVAKGGHSAVVSAIITGDVRAAAKAPLHYEQWSEADIQRIYSQTLAVIEALDPEAGDASQTDGLASGSTRANLAPAPGERRFGSIYAPDFDAYTSAIKALSLRLDELRKAERTPANISAFHNDYVVYVWQLVSVGLALRGVNNALPSLDSISDHSMATVIRDKDGADGYHARLVPRSWTVNQQLVYWLHHVNEIRWRLAVLDPAGVARLGELISNGDMPQPFMVDRSGKISDGQISEVMRAGFERELPYPPNVGRHIFSTRHAQTLPTEELRAFKGHWIRGTEPFSMLSGFDTRSYLLQVDIDQSNLLRSLGLQPLRGLA